MSRSSYNLALHGFAVLTALATLALIGMGGLVTSHGVGMAVPDWPTTYGYNMFLFPVSQWIGGIFYEHTHRLAASAVGLFTSILAVWLYGRNARPFLRWLGVFLLVMGMAVLALSSRRGDGVVLGVAGLTALGASFVWPSGEPAAKWLRRLGLIAFFGVLFQGVLGGLRVTLFKDELGIFHAALAQLFLLLMCALALFTGRSWQRLSEAPFTAVPKNLRLLLVATTALIFAQLVIGATMRHQHAGLAIPDFPLAHGRLWPAMDTESIARYNQQRMELKAVNPITAFGVGLQMAHRIAAVLIAGAVGVCAWAAKRRLGWGSRLTKLAVTWFGLILVQVVLGAATVWYDKAADITTLHVVVGALSLVAGGMLSIAAFGPLTLRREGTVFLKRTASPPTAFGRKPRTAADAG